MVGSDNFVVASEYHCALDLVLKLTDVAGPLRLREQFDRGCRQARDAFAIALRQNLGEPGGEHRNVFSPLSQRWNAQRKRRKPIIEVFAKPAQRDCLLEVAVGSRDDSHVDFLHAGGTQGYNLAFLQYPQQLGLDRERQITNLVEEKHPFIRGLKESGLVFCRSGESTAPVPEQLALNQRLGKSSAIDRQKGLVGTGAGPKWIARAINSLPTPVSPSIRTATEDAAALPTERRSCSIGGNGWVARGHLLVAPISQKVVPSKVSDPRPQVLRRRLDLVDGSTVYRERDAPCERPQQPLVMERERSAIEAARSPR